MRNARQFLLILAVLLAVLRPSMAQPEEESADGAESAFRRAFTEKLSPEERVEALERVVKEQADSVWADDALWVLGEAARRQGLADRVVYYWQHLMAGHRVLHLEEFTRALPVYQASGLPQVAFFMDATGTGYVHEDGTFAKADKVFVDAKPIDPAPMLVWEGLARSYERLKKPELALKAYGKAMESAPPAGPWGKRYEERLRNLERELELTAAKAAAEAEKESPPAASAPPEGAPRAAEEAELPAEPADQEQEATGEHEEGD